MHITIEKPGSPEDLVEHFGIKGMHWGVRKSEDSSGGKSSTPNDRIFKDARAKRRERRAKGHEAEAKKQQDAIDLIKANPSKWRIVQHHRNNLIKEHEKERDLRLKDASDIRAGKFTTFQRKALIGAGVTAGILATYGTYKMIDSGRARQILTKGKPLKTNELLSGKKSAEDIMKTVVPQVNPGYGDMGTKVNCRRCTFAYEMRRRGYDVKATNTVTGAGQTIAGSVNATNPGFNLPSSRIGLIKTGTQEALRQEKTGISGPLTRASKLGNGLGKLSVGDKNFGSIENSFDKAKVLTDTISKYPDGARGELGVEWKSGGAHSMAWEKIDGVVHIFDTQTGKQYSDSRDLAGLAMNIQKAGTTRLDNVNLNDEFLRRWVRDVK